MEIFETIILIIAWLFTLIWMYGVRTRPVVVGTSLISLTILVFVAVFSVTEWPKFHLLWLIPVIMFVGVHIYTFIIVNVPILNTVLITIGKLYTEVLRFGVSPEKKEEMYKKYKENMKSMLNEIFQKKMEEIDNKVKP